VLRLLVGLAALLPVLAQVVDRTRGRRRSRSESVAPDGAPGAAVASVGSADVDDDFADPENFDDLGPLADPGHLEVPVDFEVPVDLTGLEDLVDPVGPVDLEGPTEAVVVADGSVAADAVTGTAEEAGLRAELDALGAVETELADVELALRRLDDGSYGRCEVCDGVIDDTRLAEAPAARFCRAHLPITLG
jgi:hypothetical protein